MTTELLVLALALLLQVGQFAVYAVLANLDVGPGYTMSARDREPSRQMRTVTARLGRAFNNHFEALILFGGAVVVVTLSGQSSPVTAALAWVYLGARVLYVPAYALGWRPGRSIIWFAGFLATVGMVISSLV